MFEILSQFYFQHTNITVQMLVFKYCFVNRKPLKRATFLM